MRGFRKIGSGLRPRPVGGEPGGRGAGLAPRGRGRPEGRLDAREGSGSARGRPRGASSGFRGRDRCPERGEVRFEGVLNPTEFGLFRRIPGNGLEGGEKRCRERRRRGHGAHPAGILFGDPFRVHREDEGDLPLLFGRIDGEGAEGFKGGQLRGSGNALFPCIPIRYRTLHRAGGGHLVNSLEDGEGTAQKER